MSYGALRLVECAGLVVSLCTACGASVDEPAPPTARLQQAASAAADFYPGYIHNAENSSFDPTSTADLGLPLATTVAVRSYTELGFERVEGPRGISSHNPQTGFAGATPSADVLRVVKPFGATLEEHHSKVREYFVGAGLPSDQIRTVSGGAQVEEIGAVGDPARITRPVSYTSVITRSILGVPVYGSGAVASLADSGQAISEAVFWPSIPTGPVTEAAAWKAGFTGDAVVAFRAKLPPDIDWSQADARVVVVHQSARWTGAAYARAVLHVSTPEKVYRFLQDGTEFTRPEGQ